MALRPFNSVDGFSVTSNASVVIDANGNVYANSLSVTDVANLGNVSNVVILGGNANAAVAGTVTVVGGEITDIAIVSGGDGYDYPPTVTITDTSTPSLIANVTAVLTSGSVSSITINNGGAGYVSPTAAIAAPNAKYLKTDGYGNLTWEEVATTGGGGSGNPGGANTDVQFNDSGILGGNANFTFDKTTSTLTVTGDIKATTLYNDNVRVVDYGGLMPYYVESTEVILIPNNKQGLYSYPITIDGTLQVDGILVEV